MSLARAGRRAAQAALRRAERACLLPAPGSGPGERRLLCSSRAGPRVPLSDPSTAAVRGARVFPASPASLAALHAVAARRLALAVVGGTAVAGACGLALCDASASASADDSYVLRHIFGRRVPAGKEEEVYEDDGVDDEPEDPDQAASSAGSPPSPSDPDADALALAHPPVADDPLTGAELMLDLARQHWRSLLLTVLVTVLASLLKMTSMRHMSRLYDLIKPAARAGAAGAPGGPLRPLLELAALRGAEAAAKYFLARASGDARTAMETNLRRRLFAALITEDTAGMERRTSGETRERLGSEVAHVSDVVTRALTGGVKSVAVAAHGGASLFRISWEISAVALGMVPPGVALFGTLGALSARAHGRAAAAKERAASVAAERLAGARTVRTFAAEDREAERYAEALEEAARARRIATRIHALHLALFAAVPSTAVAAWLWYGGRLVERGRLTVGELTTVVPLALEVANALAGLSELHAEVNKGVDAADRAAAVLSARQVIEVDARRRLLAAVDPPANGNENFPGNETPGGESRGSSSSTSDALPRVMRGAIEFRDVRFAYPSRPDRVVLDALNLTLAPGEVFALVGPSGGGKSTVGALLERFYDPAEGDVLVDGVRVSDLDPRWLRRNVGAVSQDPTLFAGTVAENIAYARPNAAREEIVAAAKAANAHEFVSRFPDGYETRVGERGAGLSGGQRQRIAIARVLLADPAVLLLDEATSALDARSERAVTEALERAARGRTTLLVAHRLSTVRRAHRVGVLKDGQLVECGTHEELMRKGGEYADLVRTQLAA